MTRSNLWTTAELALLYARVHDPDCINELVPLLPGRTRVTIRNRMSQLRKEAGINIRASEFGLERRYG